MAKKKGIFIVFEGIDGAGKSTQTKLLAQYLKKRGFNVEIIDFPQHGKPSSALVDNYLTGRYGLIDEVGPYSASIFYACDRYDASFKIREWLKQGKVVIVDRYTASNMGHQGGKIKNKQERKRYFHWLYDLEYGIFKIPKPDLIIILKTNPGFSRKFSRKITDEKKKAKKKMYLGNKKQDLHEKNKEHSRMALISFLQAAREFPRDFRVVECIDRGKFLPPDIIHQKVIKYLNKFLTR